MPQPVQPRLKRRRGSVPRRRARRLVQLRPPEAVTPPVPPQLRSLQPQLSAVRIRRILRTQQHRDPPAIQKQQQSKHPLDHRN